MTDTFAITIIFVVICTMAGAFVKGRSKDRCLKSFAGHPITIRKKDGSFISGNLRVETSGMELVYDSVEEGLNVKASSILYKNEYETIYSLIRYVDELDAKGLKIRERDLNRTSHTNFSARFIRNIRNFFGTIRDSLLEVTNLFMGRAKTMIPAGQVLQGQDKYTSSLQQQLVGAAGTSYEPILERYVGRKVVLSVSKDTKNAEYSGILKDYTTDFIEIMDVEYAEGGSQNFQKADLVVSRTLGKVRHSGE